MLILRRLAELALDGQTEISPAQVKSCAQTRDWLIGEGRLMPGLFIIIQAVCEALPLIRGNYLRAAPLRRTAVSRPAGGLGHRAGSSINR